MTKPIGPKKVHRYNRLPATISIPDLDKLSKERENHATVGDLRTALCRSAYSIVRRPREKSMHRKPLNALVEGVVTKAQGDSRFMRDVAPFFDHLENSLCTAGLGEAVDKPRRPPGFEHNKMEVRMEVGVAAALIAVAVFVGSSIGSWAVKRVCDDLWDKHVRPALPKLRPSRKAAQLAPFWFQFSVYYAHDELLVTVRALISSSEDLALAQRLIPQAERRARAFLAARGIDCHELIYTVREGQLSDAPRKQ